MKSNVKFIKFSNWISSNVRIRTYFQDELNLFCNIQTIETYLLYFWKRQIIVDLMIDVDLFILSRITSLVRINSSWKVDFYFKIGLFIDDMID